MKNKEGKRSKERQIELTQKLQNSNKYNQGTTKYTIQVINNKYINSYLDTKLSKTSEIATQGYKVYHSTH